MVYLHFKGSAISGVAVTHLYRFSIIFEFYILLHNGGRTPLIHQKTLLSASPSQTVVATIFISSFPQLSVRLVQ